MATTFNNTSNHLGVDLDNTATTQIFALGTRVLGTSGTEWEYIQASGALVKYDALSLDEDFQAAQLTEALAATLPRFGVAQIAFADNDFGFVLLNGTGNTNLVQVNCLALCAADVQLFATTTAGSLDDAGTTAIQGISITTTVGGSAASAEAIITWPHAES